MTQAIPKHSDNPAQRLHAILVKCQGINAKTTCRGAWQTVLGTDDEADLLDRIAKLLQLTVEVENVVECAYPKHTNHARVLRLQVHEGISRQSMNGEWQAFLGNISVNSVTHLELIADLLNERPHLRAVESESLIEQRDVLIELGKQISQATDVDAGVKLTILKHLERLISAINEYFITGTFPVLDATKAAMADIVFDDRYATALKSTESGKKFAGVLSTLASWTTVATGVAQLVEPVTKIFHMLSGGENQ